MKTVWARESHQESKQPLGIENTTFHLLGGGGGGTAAAAAAAAAAADKSVNFVEAEEGHVKTLWINTRRDAWPIKLTILNC